MMVTLPLLLPPPVMVWWYSAAGCVQLLSITTRWRSAQALLLSSCFFFATRGRKVTTGKVGVGPFFPPIQKNFLLHYKMAHLFSSFQQLSLASLATATQCVVHCTHHLDSMCCILGSSLFQYYFWVFFPLYNCSLCTCRKKKMGY